jgi:hypothetical protein
LYAEFYPEEDVFESDFESTDEEEYAKQGVEDGEKQVQIEEKAERRVSVLFPCSKCSTLRICWPGSSYKGV